VLGFLTILPFVVALNRHLSAPLRQYEPLDAGDGLDYGSQRGHDLDLREGWLRPWFIAAPNRPPY
jgi:hypothetical protein